MNSKRFTVKDFIAYNNPCFSCGSKISFKLGFLDIKSPNPSNKFSYLRPTVTNDYVEIDLSITYSNFVKLYIFHKTNKILSNNYEGLTKYLGGHKIFLTSTCDTCSTHIESHFLDISLERKLIRAVGISAECLIVYDDRNHYRLSSAAIDEKSVLFVTSLDRVGSYSTIEMPILLRHRFKNRQHFLDKVKLYTTFS